MKEHVFTKRFNRFKNETELKSALDKYLAGQYRVYATVGSPGNSHYYVEFKIMGESRNDAENKLETALIKLDVAPA